MTRDQPSGSPGRQQGSSQQPIDKQQDSDNLTAGSGNHTSHAVWSALAYELIAALTALEGFIAWRARTGERHADHTATDQDQGEDEVAAIVAELQEVREHVHHGVAWAAVQLAQFAEIAASHLSDGESAATWRWGAATAYVRSLDHPLNRLVRAYGAAFGSVEAASTSLARTPSTQVPGAAGRLVELAVRSAKGLRQAMNLAFGQQGLGTVQHLCDHIATLENQADALYHSAVATFLSRQRAAGQAGQWTADNAAQVRCLETLEALTDRCEEIAEELLLAEHLL